MGDSKEDPSVYVNVLDNVLSQDIQGLIVNICDQQLSKMTVDKCAEAGIPVVAVDVPLIDDAGNYLAPAIELDSYLSGKTMGEWLADYIGKNELMTEPETTGMMILAMEKVTSCVPRSDGQYDAFKAAFPEFPEGNIIRIDYGGGSSDEGYNAAAATITANPQIKRWFVTAANDEGAQGATARSSQAGLDQGRRRDRPGRLPREGRVPQGLLLLHRLRLHPGVGARTGVGEGALREDRQRHAHL